MQTKKSLVKRMLSIVITLLMVLSIVPISSLTAIKADAAVAYGDYGVKIEISSKYCQKCGSPQMGISRINITKVTLEGTTLKVDVEYYFSHLSCYNIKNTQTLEYKYFDCNSTYTNKKEYSGGSFGMSREAGHSADWTFSNNKHTGTCKLCEKTVTENCSGGTATCIEKATCSRCNNKYGSVNPDNHNYGEWSQIDVNGIKMHTRTCSLNNSHTETENCSGGDPTCLSGAMCNTCNSEYTPASGHSIVDGSCQKCGFNEESSIYEISTATQLMIFARNVNGGNKTANAILTADIDLAGYDWETICETGLYYNGYGDDSGYTGTFDGNGHVIRNVKVKSSTTRDASCGLFGTVSGTVKNLGVDGFTFVDGGHDIRTGAIVGQLITTNGKVSNCYVLNATITPGEHVTGGIAGCVYDGTIENCYVAKSTINGSKDRYGYVVGDSRGDKSDQDRRGTVKNCYADKDTLFSANKGYIDTCETVTTEQFASGEVAYLLQGEQVEQIWGQKIGAENYPVSYSDKVYEVLDCKGNTTYSNTDKDGQHNFVDGQCTICKDIEGVAKVAGYSITLEDKIGVNYFMLLSNEVRADANSKLVFTYIDAGKTLTKEIPVSDAVKSGDYYKFTCEVAAKEMTSNIEAQVVTSNANSDTFNYSVKQYAEVILADAETYAKEQNIVKAMLNYGANAQVYFNNNTDNLANDTVYMTEDEKAVNVEDTVFDSFAHSSSGKANGLTYYGSALSLESETAIKLYFTYDNEADIANVNVASNGKTVTHQKNGKYYEVKISGIRPDELNKMYETTVNGVTVNYGAFSYGKMAMGTSNENLKNVMKTLYAYSKAALEYKKA